MSVTITRGTVRVVFSSLRKKRLAAALSRRLCTRMSRTVPSASTARHRYFNSPLTLIEDLVQVPCVPGPRLVAAQPVGVGLSELGVPAADGLVGDDHAELQHQLLDLAEAERKRKYRHTQGEITSAGYRCPLYDGDVLPTDDPPPP
ncbi:hypothetical protein SHIRM173S_05064 [Streptomyces hirsutus]